MSEYPPDMYFVQVLQHCPKAADTYRQLWLKKDKDNKVTFLKKETKLEFLTSTAKFNNNLLLLAREGVVNIYEFPDEITVELLSWDDAMDTHDFY